LYTGDEIPVEACSPYLSIILPAYNESASILKTLDAMAEYLAKQPYSYEIIVAADGTDGTRELARERAKTDTRLSVLGSPKRGGKGKGIRDAMATARGQVIGFIDADYKTPIDEFEKIQPFLNEGYDVVIGSRALNGSQIKRRQPLYRRLGPKVFRQVMHLFIGLRDIPDTQCGFKFFTASAAHDIFSKQRIDGYMFDVEVLRLVKLLNYRLKQVGIDWRDDGDTRYNPVTGTLKNARELLKIRWLTHSAGALPQKRLSAPVPAASTAR